MEGGEVWASNQTTVLQTAASGELMNTDTGTGTPQKEQEVVWSTKPAHAV